MLLDLYVKKQMGKEEVCISSVGLACHVAPTTALRYIYQLEERGLVETRDDPNDGRRRYVLLSSESRSGLDKYLDEVGRSLAAAVSRTVGAIRKAK